MVKQTAGRDQLGIRPPNSAGAERRRALWAGLVPEQELSLRDRSIITVVALVSKGSPMRSLKYHIGNAKKNGVTREEMVEIITTLPLCGLGPTPGRCSPWCGRSTRRQ